MEKIMTYQMIGEFECTLDSKGRFRIPSDLLRQLGDEPVRVMVLNRGLDDCLVLYPKEIWAIERDEITSKIDKFNPEHRRFERAYLGGACEVEIDAQDRILLTKRFVEFAKLEKDIVVIAKKDRIEIWDYKKYSAEIDFSTFDLSAEAKNILGTSGLNF